jgi:hypothetical protein
MLFEQLISQDPDKNGHLSLISNSGDLLGKLIAWD